MTSSTSDQDSSGNRPTEVERRPLPWNAFGPDPTSGSFDHIPANREPNAGAAHATAVQAAKHPENLFGIDGCKALTIVTNGEDPSSTVPYGIHSYRQGRFRAPILDRILQ